MENKLAIFPVASSELYKSGEIEAELSRGKVQLKGTSDHKGAVIFNPHIFSMEEGNKIMKELEILREQYLQDSEHLHKVFLDKVNILITGK